jgi:hypothetical protein
VRGVTGMDLKMKQDCVRKFCVDLGETGMKAFEMLRKLFILESSA